MAGFKASTSTKSRASARPNRASTLAGGYFLLGQYRPLRRHGWWKESGIPSGWRALCASCPCLHAQHHMFQYGSACMLRFGTCRWMMFGTRLQRGTFGGYSFVGLDLKDRES
jgi:hypothetical protein